MLSLFTIHFCVPVYLINKISEVNRDYGFKLNNLGIVTYFNAK